MAAERLEQAGDDARWMALALAQARLAGAAGEVPVGAVVVKDGAIVGRGFNRNIHDRDPSAHAEIVALRDAAANLGNHRLEGCRMYVTLEPCAMCTGAILHARISELVFGADDPKGGAAGSVTNLFADTRLNHHTKVTPGVEAATCAALLRTFFEDRRQSIKTSHVALREDAVRTPEGRFEGLPGYPWAPRYMSDLPALDGLRMHYLDEGPRDAAMVFLCLNGNPAWSYLYRHMIPVWLGHGARIVAPDLIGFGKSDKPKDAGYHRFALHRQILDEFIERLDLRNIALVVQDWGGILGLTLPMLAPARYAHLLVMNTMLACGDQPLGQGFLDWRSMCRRKPEFDVGKLFARSNPHLSPAECSAYNAPFPDVGHRAALRAFPELVPDHSDAAGAEISRTAREFWRHDWTGSSLMATGMQDPVLGPQVMEHLRADIRGCVDVIEIPHAGHFVQEHGRTIAEDAWQQFAGR